MNIVRVAVCQVETHPAVYLSHIAYLEEPFVPLQRDISLGHFAANGTDVYDLQQQCKDAYVSWAGIRIQGILENLSRLDPIPCLVVFPEASIPVENLPAIAKWSSQSKSVVLAGTHTPLGTAAAKSIYRELGIDTGQINQLTRKGKRNVLPLFISGKLKLIPKRVFSPFEQTIVGSATSNQPLFRGRPVACGGAEIALVPLICSEALAAPQLRDPIDLIAVVSYDAKPDQFHGFCHQQVHNKRAVIYCNDGAYGGSRIFVVDDARSENWLSASCPTGMPPGDGYLVADVDLDVAAIEVSTARPARALKLVQLASIVTEDSPPGRISARLRQIARLDDPAARAQELDSLLLSGDALPLQRIKINHLYELERRGVPSSDWWPVVGEDCIVQHASSLRELEARLAATCSQHLVSNIASVSVQKGSLAQSLVRFLAECQARSGTAKAFQPNPRHEEIRSTLNRDDAANQIYQFLNHPRLRLLEVSGLPQIGKSCALDKALAQAGIQRVVRVALTDSSSPDYLVYSIVRSVGRELTPPFADPVSVASGEEVARAIRATEVLLLENAHGLLEYGAWRDPRLPAVIFALIGICEQEKRKLVIETQRDLPLQLPDPLVRTRLRITGLQPIFGQTLFDGQLRRVGLSPDVVTEEQKAFVVQKLGGHPVAISIAADAIYESSPSDVVRLLRNRQGFFLNFLRTLISGLHLADEEQTLLRIFSLARNYVPREVVAEAAAFSTASFVRNLLALGALETGEAGLLRIAPILRDYFDAGDLPKDITDRFHRAASLAFGALSKRHPKELQFAVEADYHAALGGLPTVILPNLIDGALAVAKNHFSAQKYDDAYSIIAKLLQSRARPLEVVRLGAQIQARRNQFQQALELAKDAFARNRNDTWLLAELAKIALTLSRDDIAEQLVGIAEHAAVEDTSILLVKGRMALRRRRIELALQCFERAKQLTDRNAWPFFYLGRVYLQLGRLDDAIDVLYDGERFVQDNHIRGRRVLSAIRTQLAYCYLFDDQLDLAEPIILRLWEDERSPEVIRAYAALTIKKRGISQAHEALKELERAEIRNHYDRCQFHLLYGLFYLGIGEASRATAEFEKAHKADKTNVFVMINLARTLLTTASELWADGSDEHQPYVRDCAALVSEILGIDSDNQEGIELAHQLYTKFKVEVKAKQVGG